MCEVNLLLTYDGIQYFNADNDMIVIPEDAVIVDDDVIMIPLEFILQPCELPNNLFYYGIDESLCELTSEVRG